ncbi:amino acid adenylation domain-containing protein [Rhodanobacter sp. Si-c]|uniref:Amino acid adenylation domain-containing protein n=1 Tax=Rhodanobacter lycopersici TaxID=3162487 RepID=A0ABV3QJC0_9GAMM
MDADGLTLGFLYQAHVVPGHVALADDTYALKYAELRSRVLTLAGQLVAAGVVPGDVVAVACDRSVESVVSIIAVYAAGAAYLPLDLSYPPVRLAQMLEDARPRLAVIVPGAPSEVLRSLDLAVVESTMTGPAEALAEPVVADADLPAYVLFTSGSTGRPKGAVLSRRALQHLVAWHLHHPRLGQPVRMLQFFTLGFDPSVRDIFATFATEGTLLLAAEPQRRDPFRLLEMLREQRVERTALPYVALRAMAQAYVDGGVLPESLREVVTGGEALAITPAIRQLFAALPGAALYNEYGPTESCVFVTSNPLDGDPMLWPELPDIGRPLSHVRLHVADEHLQLVADGIEGELLIGGETLADGYINRPELNAEHFVRIRGIDGVEERVYRSGDRVRQETDGRIVFLGRLDEQVKVAGYRIELGEVEAALASHPAVRDVAVVAPSGPTGRRLVAHVLLTRDAPPAADLRGEFDRHLAARLPAYACPQGIIFRDGLPLTPNGKIDRRQLEAESATAAEVGVVPMPFGAAPEDRVVALWRELLAAPDLGVDDNVFDRGADSLLVMVFITRWRALAGSALSAAAVYAYPTSRQQAQLSLSVSSSPTTPAASVEGMTADADLERTGLPLDVPLSDGQMEKWFASQFGGMASLAFNESSVLRLDGVLNPVAFRQALERVWQRHESLRFSFAADGSSQRFNAEVPLPFAELDHAEPSATAEARFDAFCEQQIRQPFDLTKPPLVRFTLVRLDECRHALHVITHHLVMDGWSLAVFVGELAACYNALASGREPELAPAASFRRYVIDARARRMGGATATCLDYWRQVYAAPVAALRLPADRPAPKQPDYAAATARHEFAPALSDALRTTARQRGVSLYSLLLSGLGVLLARLSGQHDFAVAVPFAGLALAGDEALMGDGVSGLPLRLRVEPEWPLGELVSRTHAALLDAAAHQDTTLTAIQRMLGLRATSGEAALTGVEFTLLPRAASVAFEGLTHALRECPRAALDWDMSFNFSDTGETLALSLHYATARYDASTVRRWIGFYEALLHDITGLGDTPAAISGTVADIDLLGASGRAEVLQAWNATAMPYDREQGVTALIEAQMRRAPQRIAVECGGRAMDCAALDQATHALAAALGRRGIGRGELVGVCVPRSLEMLIAVLGVLRSGAAYVPLDPEFPAERLQHMAEHSGLRHVLVTSAELLLPAVAMGRTLLDVNTLVAEPADGVELPLVRGDDLAYVLYTSGSTGQPKGVGITHRNLVNFLLGMSREPGFGPDDVLCAVTTLSFDIAGMELYLPLVVGARLVIATEEERHEPQLLWDLMERGGCNVLQTTPSLLRLLMDTGRDDAVRDLRLFVGGEALPLEVANSLAGRCREFWNLYGPTETTIWSTVARIEPGITVAPLGKPIANTRIYVLDPHGQPVLPGLIGEIWIGGDGVADGYLHRPDLTAERFLPDPFVGGAARMYRTGDLGTWRDGVLHFHGRADNQIKIRGYRIEPGDIEAATDGYPSVRECVVIAHRFGDNDLRLVLYAVVGGDRANMARSLREHLRTRLPAYMLPQHIELLDALPKTPNGKIDRKALPEPSAVDFMAHAGQVETPASPFSNQREAYLAEIWRDLVGARDVRSSDNFFDVGGHSLLAVEFVTRVQRETGVRINLLDVAASTLASLALELPEMGAAPSRQNVSLGARLRRFFGLG